MRLKRKRNCFGIREAFTLRMSMRFKRLIVGFVAFIEVRSKFHFSQMNVFYVFMILEAIFRWASSPFVF